LNARESQVYDLNKKITLHYIDAISEAYFQQPSERSSERQFVINTYHNIVTDYITIHYNTLELFKVA